MSASVFGNYKDKIYILIEKCNMWNYSCNFLALSIIQFDYFCERYDCGSKVGPRGFCFV